VEVVRYLVLVLAPFDVGAVLTRGASGSGGALFGVVGLGLVCESHLANSDSGTHALPLGVLAVWPRHACPAT
jgi:hypothetical protein